MSIEKHKFTRSKLLKVEKMVLDHVGLEVVIEDKEWGLGHGVITSSSPRKALWQKIKNWPKTSEPDYKFAYSNEDNYGLRYADLQALYTGLVDYREIIDSFVDAPNLGNFDHPEVQREHSTGIIVKVLSTYNADKVSHFIQLCDQYETWDRWTLGEMVLDEGIDLVLEALNSSFSDDVPLYKGALKERLMYEHIKSQGIQEQNLKEKTISITRGCFLWSSKAVAERWDLKGHIDDVGGEIFYIQGHPIALQGFVNYLKAMDGIDTVKVVKRDVSYIYERLTGGTKPCGCW